MWFLSHYHQFLVYLCDICTKVPDRKIFNVIYLKTVIRKYFLKHLLNTSFNTLLKELTHIYYSSKELGKFRKIPRVKKKQVTFLFLVLPSILLLQLIFDTFSLINSSNRKTKNIQVKFPLNMICVSMFYYI